MHIKFLKHGRGDARKAVAYLLATHDHKGVERASVEVLRGDPQQFAEVANSLNFQHKYRSGVIPWAPEDKPSPQQIEKTLDQFESLAFAGLEQNRFVWCAVKHTEQNGAVHIHNLIARVDLETGKSFNPAPPGWQKDFDPLRDALNYENGWSRPNDPARARLVQPGHHALFDAAALRTGLNSPNAKEQITGWLVQRIEAGQVNDRAGVVASLAEVGEITRQGKDYISVKPVGFEKAIRLKGAVYDQDFKRDEFIRAAERKAATGSATDRTADQRAAQAARRDLAAAILRRAEYNRQRYSTAAASIEQKSDKHPQGHSATEPDADKRDPGSDQALGLVDEVATADSPDHLPRALLRDLGLVPDPDPVGNHENPERPAIQDAQGRVDIVHDQQKSGSVPTDQLTAKEKRSDEKSESGSHDSSARLSPFARAVARGKFVRAFEPLRNRDADRPGLQSSKRLVPQRLPLLRQPSASPGFQQRGHVVLLSVVQRFRNLHHALHRLYAIMRHSHDRARTSSLANSIEAVQRVDSAIASRASPVESLAESGRLLDAASRGLATATQDLKQKQRDEIESFKTQINLAEYAQSLGYEVDQKESSRASTVMRRGDDKIIVATDADGHGIYFSVHDDRDNGTIIDFAQRRQGKNLGQVRKELRPWIGSASSSYRPQRRTQAERPKKPAPSNHDRQKIFASWLQMQPAGKHQYLMRERKLSATILADARFASQIRIDDRRNTVFPHFDHDGLTGYELKNKGFTGFARGGEKAVWHSSNLDHAPRVVVVESAIDAMSHAQLKRDREAAYISTGGAMSDKQRQLLREHLAAAKDRGAEIILATDNDEGGNKLATEISHLIPDAPMTRVLPTDGKDWNDMLQKQVDHEKSRWNGPSYHM